MEFFHVDECDEIDVDRYNQLEDCLTDLTLYVKLRKERRQQLKQEAQRTKVMNEQLMCAHREGQAKIAENYEKFLQSEKNTTLLSAIHERQQVANKSMREASIELANWRESIVTKQKQRTK